MNGIKKITFALLSCLVFFNMPITARGGWGVGGGVLAGTLIATSIASSNANANANRNYYDQQRAFEQQLAHDREQRKLERELDAKNRELEEYRRASRENEKN